MMHSFSGPRACGVAPAASNTLFFVDQEVLSPETILSGLNRGTIVKRLPRTGDALDAIASFAEIRTTPVERIVILAHGSAGNLRLSGQEVDSTTLRDAGDALARIHNALAPDAEIVLISCATSASSAGRTFLRILGVTTGATVMAADADIGGTAGWKALPVAATLVDNNALASYPHRLGDALEGNQTTSMDESAASVGQDIVYGNPDDDILRSCDMQTGSAGMGADDATQIVPLTT